MRARQAKEPLHPYPDGVWRSSTPGLEMNIARCWRSFSFRAKITYENDNSGN